MVTGIQERAKQPGPRVEFRWTVARDSAASRRSWTVEERTRRACHLRRLVSSLATSLIICCGQVHSAGYDAESGEVDPCLGRPRDGCDPAICMWTDTAAHVCQESEIDPAAEWPNRLPLSFCVRSCEVSGCSASERCTDLAVGAQGPRFTCPTAAEQPRHRVCLPHDWGVPDYSR